MKKKGDGDKPRRKSPIVVGRRGVRRRFLRGMVTHDLVQRGLDFDTGYALARTVRDRLAGREEVTTDEIQSLVADLVVEALGAEAAARVLAPIRVEAGLRVVYHGEELPFSRGLLARSLHAAGVDLDRAYNLVTRLEAELREGGETVLASDELARRAGALLERLEGEEAARRYWVVRRIHQLPRPIVLYVGGATGTGKSTLALELAPLLRIYRITATDTIRQMMRMLFSSTLLPALHASSFELALTRRSREEAEVEAGVRSVYTFEEQAARVAVGVRAVVERAIAENMSIVVEGVHLYPPLVPFADLEGAAYQVPLMLTVPDPEAHRARFLGRARRSGRRAERYVEHFTAIRQLHELLLQQAEAYDVPILDTSRGGDRATAETLRVVTSLLERRLPRRTVHAWRTPQPAPPTLLVIVDGLADRPVRALGGRTPLQAARTPTLDRLAREGQCGLADPVAPGVVPDTAAGTLAVFAQSPAAMKRGPVEALGAGIELAPGDVALRANFATLDPEGLVVDRRAGRIRDDAEALAAAIDRLPLPGGLGDGIEIRVKKATEHRLAIVLKGEGLSSSLQGSDPGDGAIPGPPLAPRPDDPQDPTAVLTARVLAAFELEARRVLAQHPANAARIEAGKPAANAVLTRGAGHVHRLLPLEDAGVPLRIACVSGDHTVLGIAAWLGAETIVTPAMTANLDTDLQAKLETAGAALRRRDLVVVHVKGADIAAHDQRPDLKLAFLERLDRELGRFLEGWSGPLRISVAADHATLSESGQHAADPLPVLVWGDGVEADDVQTFDEVAVSRGSLHRFPLQMLLGRLFELR